MFSIGIEMCKVSSGNITMHTTPIPTTVAPNDNDILCAHRKFCYKHQGNVNFRIMIDTNLPNYIDPKTTRKERALIIDSILRKIYKDDCSFLRKGIDGWYVLNKKEAREKVAHSMRDARGEMKRWVLRKNALTARRERDNNSPRTEDADYSKHEVSEFLSETSSDNNIRFVEGGRRQEEVVIEGSDEETTNTVSSQRCQQQNSGSGTHGIFPTVDDILCGQGKSCYDHQGNQYFRKIIASNLPKYLDSKTSKSEKTSIIGNVTERLCEEGCLFLREVHDGWVVLSKHEGREKVAHALRDAKFGLKRRENKLAAERGKYTRDGNRNNHPYQFLQRNTSNSADVAALLTGINNMSDWGEDRSLESSININNNVLTMEREGGIIAKDYNEDISLELLKMSANMYNVMLDQGNNNATTTSSHYNNRGLEWLKTSTDIDLNDDDRLHTIADDIILKPVFGCVVFGQ